MMKVYCNPDEIEEETTPPMHDFTGTIFSLSFTHDVCVPRPSSHVNYWGSSQIHSTNAFLSQSIFLMKILSVISKCD